MASLHRKRDLPVNRVRELLEPGPVLLVTSGDGDVRDVMTLGWHCVMEFSPALVGCLISRANHSFDLIRRSRECVLNIPSAEMVDTVVAVGNSTGAEIDKFTRFGLGCEPASDVNPPLLADCFANLECRVSDDALVDSHDFFVLEVVRVHVSPKAGTARTLHYRGGGRFMISGETIDRSDGFTKVS